MYASVIYCVLSYFILCLYYQEYILCTLDTMYANVILCTKLLPIISCKGLYYVCKCDTLCTKLLRIINSSKVLTRGQSMYLKAMFRVQNLAFLPFCAFQVYYCIAGNFRGIQFSWLTSKPRKLNP